MRCNPRPPGRGRRAGARGFTLIEVILAVAILGIGLSVLVMTAARCIGVARRARDLETARRMIARVQLEFPLDKAELQEGEESGDFEDGPPGFVWQRAILPAGEEDRGLFEVRTKVLWSENGTEAFEDVTTWVFAPESTSGRATP